MFKTNTAPCGGFPGISNSFGAALWATDFGSQMAYTNFSEALLQVGGQNDYYNPFISPPAAQAAYLRWTVGAVFYASLVLAEAFGKSGKSRVMDLAANNGNPLTPHTRFGRMGCSPNLRCSATLRTQAALLPVT